MVQLHMQLLAVVHWNMDYMVELVGKQRKVVDKLDNLVVPGQLPI